MNRAPGSFRDPSGYVYDDGKSILRTIDISYKEHWEKSARFIYVLSKKGLILPFEEIEPADHAWKTIQTERLPFVSYPYEWSVSQLKDAALLTLKIQRLALKEGLILKDASAYNIQFKGSQPVFIDHLSFEILEEGKPWDAYRQFCSHFLAPLALSCFTDLRCGGLSRLWIDGIPLDLAAKLLPLSARFKFGLLFHLFFHARMQNKYSDTSVHAGQAKKVHISKSTLDGIAASLERAVNGLNPADFKTEWGDYYDATNYSEAAAKKKYDIVQDMLERGAGGSMAVDLGANTGLYTKLLAKQYKHVLAVDIDPLAVERHYRSLKDSNEYNILPLILDLSSPSPDLGFHCSERPSFMQRCKADCITALALIHHLSITAGIPLHMQADFFADLLIGDGMLILEFVPKEDSQVKRLLALRKDIFKDYTLDRCVNIFNRHFNCLQSIPIPDSCRTLLLLRKKV